MSTDEVVRPKGESRPQKPPTGDKPGPKPPAAAAVKAATAAAIDRAKQDAKDQAKKAAAAVGPATHQGQLTVTQDGVRAEPINVYVHGSLDDIRAGLQKAGFTEALPNTAGSKARFVGEAVVDVVGRGLSAGKAKVAGWIGKLTGHADKAFANPAPLAQNHPRAVDNMPISTQFLDGKPQVTAFSSQNDPLAGRHHFRVFDTGKTDEAGKEIFAIQASRDVGICFDKNRPGQLFMNHAVEKNTDGERDFVVQQLKGAGVVERSEKVEHMKYGEVGYYGDKSEDDAAVDLTVKAAKK